MERLAPDAPLLQLSNPMGIVVGALARATRLRVLGLCELPQDTLERAAALVGARGPLESDYVGMNHQGFFTSIRAGGQELLPAIARALPADGGWFGVDGAFVARERCLPLRYLRNYLSREQVVAGAGASASRRPQPRARAPADALFRPRNRLTARRCRPSLASECRGTLAIVPALAAPCAAAAEPHLSAPNRGAVPFARRRGGRAAAAARRARRLARRGAPRAVPDARAGFRAASRAIARRRSSRGSGGGSATGA